MRLEVVVGACEVLLLKTVEGIKVVLVVVVVVDVELDIELELEPVDVIIVAG